METNRLTFGLALQAIKDGQRVARAGWNGKGMFVWLEKGSIDGDKLGFSAGENPVAGHPSTMNGVSLGLFLNGDQGTATRMPHLSMRAADGSTVTGWLASQTDMLAEDWTIVEAA